MRGCLWRRRFPPADGNRGESTRTTGGRPANSGGSFEFPRRRSGARWGELWHVWGGAPLVYRHVAPGVRGAHAEGKRRRRTAVETAASGCRSGSAGPQMGFGGPAGWAGG
jgi:hypothetical protein